MTNPADKLPILTRAESELMQTLWTRGPLTVAQIVEELDRGVAYNTALTLLRILETKGYVVHRATPGSRAFIYAAQSPAGKVQAHHLRDLTQRLFGGQSKALVATLLDDSSLSQDELKGLRDEIDARLGKKEGGK